MTAFNNNFAQFHKILKVSPQYYNYNSINLLTNMFSNNDVLKNLLGIRELIVSSKIVEGKFLKDFLEHSYIRDYKFDYWVKIKEARKGLFSIEKQ